MGKTADSPAENLQPYESLQPENEEKTIISQDKNIFRNSDLHKTLQNLGVDNLLIAGLTAEKEILFSVTAALELGYSCTLAQDAVASTSLKQKGEKIKANLVHQVIMAALQNAGAETTGANKYIKTDLKKEKKRLKDEERKRVSDKMESEAVQTVTQAVKKSKAETSKEKKVAEQEQGSTKKKGVGTKEAVKTDNPRPAGKES